MFGKQADALHKRTLAIWGLIAFVGLGEAAAGRGFRAGAEPGKLTLRLRVYNYAISRRLLAGAEAEATVILNSAGLDPVWIDCPLSDAESKTYPSCEPAIGTADFIITIVTKTGPERVSQGEDAMGQALPCPKTQMGCAAYVFYKDIQDEAAFAKVQVFRLLGHVFAHEIGHLLLGPNSHSPTGIMMAAWSDEDMQTVARGFLLFSDEQSRQMRDTLIGRSTTAPAALHSL
jgi:hypothetical protein